MMPVSWPAFSKLHPFAPVEQARGLRADRCGARRGAAGVTGFDAVSLQPNSGAQGELAGLLVIARGTTPAATGTGTSCSSVLGARHQTRRAQ